MSTLKYKSKNIAAKSLSFTDNLLIVKLTNNREIHVPLTSYPNLRNLSEEEKKNYSILANGRTLNWKSIDEYLSVEYLFEDYGTSEMDTPAKKIKYKETIPSSLR